MGSRKRKLQDQLEEEKLKNKKIKEKTNKIKVQPEDETSNNPEIQKTTQNKWLRRLPKPEDVVKLEYKDFNFEDYYKQDQSYATAIIGSRYSGKTVFYHYKLYPKHKKYNDLNIKFCENLQAEAYDYLDEKDKIFAYEKFHPEIINDMFKFAKKSNNLLKTHFDFDDCSSKKNNKNNEFINQIYIRGRNNKISITFSTQDMMYISNTNRGNLDFLFLLKSNIPSMKKKIIENFLMDLVPIPEQWYTKAQRERYLYHWYEAHCDNLDEHGIIFINFRNAEMFHFKVDIEKEEKLMKKYK